jgi:DNA-binding PadR family transcriptional regulator
MSARRLSRLEHVVLGVLANEPRHGYALKQRLGPGLPPERQINDGVLYPLLARLERRGLLESRAEPGTAGRGRKVYAVTPAGREAFEDWLLGDEDEGGDLSYDLFIAQPLVKLFFAARLTPAQRRRKLRSLADAARRRLAALEAIEAQAGPGGLGDVGQALVDISVAQQRTAVDRLEALLGQGAADAAPARSSAR